MTITKNYHTHTWRCKHASQDVSAYCEAAIDTGITVLGISDHTALPDNRWPHIRMDIDELPAYCAAVDQAAADYRSLTVLKSAECEYAKEYDSFFRDKLLGELEFDYLVGAAHFFPMRGEWVSSYGGTDSLSALQAYSKYFIQSMESGLFAFMAHPDLFGNAYLSWDENTIAASQDIFTAAAELAMPLEINGYGLRKPKIDTPGGLRCMYPWLPFWELAASYDVLFIVNSDAHHPQDVNANLDEAAAIGYKLGMTMADLSHLEPTL